MSVLILQWLFFESARIVEEDSFIPLIHIFIYSYWSTHVGWWCCICIVLTATKKEVYKNDLHIASLYIIISSTIHM